jgi:hypothetical protein
MNVIKLLVRNSLIGALACKILMSKMKVLHNSESGACYILGNGSSLKNVKLAHFSDLPAIGCNLLCLHSDIADLNLKYYTFLDPMKSMGKQNRVFLGRFKEFIGSNPNIKFFVSPYDYIRIRNRNVSYLAPLSNNWPGNKDKNLALLLHRSKKPISGSLRAQILLAIYLGFDKLILVGHDYTLYPTRSGHFYENDIEEFIDLSEWNKDFLNEIAKLVDIESLGIGSESKVVKYKEIPESKRLSSNSNSKIPISKEDYFLLQRLNEDEGIGFQL